MALAASRSVRAVAALTTAGTLALTPIAIAPPDLRAPTISATRISTEAVQLTDAWYDLLNNTLLNMGTIGTLFVGANTTFPLPNPIFIAPIAAQLVINPLIYTLQLFTGKGGDIPNEILTHLGNLGDVAQLVLTQLPGIIVQQIQTPFLAVQAALEFVTSATNKLAALIEAPAVFLDAALNSQYGLIGESGPVVVPILIRNLIANALDTPLPTITLPFKKSAAAKTPKLVAATTVATPAATASSARSKPKSPSSAGSKSKPAAKSSANGSGVGHGKRK